jgi:hypothetical protein
VAQKFLFPRFLVFYRHPQGMISFYVLGKLLNSLIDKQEELKSQFPQALMLSKK